MSKSGSYILLASGCVPSWAYGQSVEASFQHDPVEHYGSRVLTGLLIAGICLVTYSLIRYRGRIVGWGAWGLLLASVGVAPLISVLFGTILVFERAEQVEFCASCHLTMQVYVDDMKDLDSGSMAAVHYKNRYIPSNQCYDCHTSYGMHGTVQAKMASMIDVYKYYTGTYQLPIQMRHPYPNNDCLKCHAEAIQWAEQELHMENKEALFSGEISCMDCHGPMGNPAHVLPEQTE